jgi:hypothetical protein
MVAKSGLTGNRAETCEFRTVEFHPIVVFLVLVDECLQNLRDKYDLDIGRFA